MRLAPLLPALLLLLSGCAGPTVAPPPVSTPPAPTLPSTPGKLELSVHGAGGDWWVAYQPVAPAESLPFRLSVEAHADAPPQGVFGLLLASPAYAVEDAAGARSLLFDDGDPNFSVHEEGRVPAIQVGMGQETPWESPALPAGSRVVGVLFAVASSGPWRANFTFAPGGGDGGALEGSLLEARGAGAAFARSPVGPDTMGQIGWDVPVPSAGWTHLQAMDQAFSADGLFHNFTVHFPNGRTASETSLSSYAGRRGVGPDYSTYFGALDDAPGTLRAELGYAYVGNGNFLGMAHVPFPFASLPGRWSPDYRGLGFAFPEGRESASCAAGC